MTPKPHPQQDETVNLVVHRFFGEMPRFPPPDLANRTPAALAELARECMEAEWNRGNRLTTEWYLEHAPNLATDPAALDVMFLEFILRQENGEQPVADDFVQRFPTFADQLRRLFDLDYAIESLVTSNTVKSDPSVISPPPPHPQTIGRFLILRSLGRGGQADVYLGIHPGLTREVVIKQWRKNADDESGAERLAAEGRLLASLEHPNLAKVFDLDIADGKPFLVMEAVHGRTLHDLRKHRPVSPAETARWVCDIAAAADYAHARGVVHLDIKPRNVILEDTGRIVLLDFGLAKVERDCGVGTEEDRISGTLAYMAPEQARGESDKVGPPTDVYGLGGVLYYLLVGRDPITAPNTSALYVRAREGDWDREALRNSGAPARLIAVCEQALAKDPAMRFPSPTAFAAAVAAAVRPWRKWRIGVPILAAFAVVAIVVVSQFMPRNASLVNHSRVTDPTPVAPIDRVVPPAKKPDLQFAIDVYRKGAFFDTMPVPFQLGEAIRFRAVVPANNHAVLLLATEAGKVEEVIRFTPEPNDRSITFPVPAGSGKANTLKLAPPAGTHVFLFVVGSTVPDRLGLKVGERWPRVSYDSVIRVVSGHAKVEVRGRDLEPGGVVEDPEGAVVARLTELLRSLSDATIEGFAIAVRPS